jgi:hypothetical protein
LVAELAAQTVDWMVVQMVDCLVAYLVGSTAVPMEQQSAAQKAE